MQRALQVGLFPAAMITTLSAIVLLHQANAEPYVFQLAAGAIGILFVVTGERLIPFRADWRQSQGDVGADAAHTVLSTMVGSALVEIAGFALFVEVGARISDAIGLDLWPDSLPFLLRVALALAIWEFGQYWAHRLTHETGDSHLWRLHVVHHSPTRLYWFNAGRDHLLGAIWLYGLASLPLFLLGIDHGALAGIVAITATHGLFQHGNVDVRLGPLNYVFSMAELHRWHHSVDIPEANHNYGATLIIWDLVFRTRSLPGVFSGPIGIGYLPNMPKDYLHQMALPYLPYWKRLKAEAAAAQPSDVISTGT